MTRPQTGFILGKFMPPHNGHVYLCEFARASCRRLTILVCSLDGDPIPGKQRFAWMRSLFPDCDVQWCHEPLPQEPAAHPDFWPIWRDVVRRYAGQPDVVFASEPYGVRLAQETGARFVPVDPGRQAVPVSATMIRTDPFRHWPHIPAPVRPWFVRRVCLFGPESTGKSSLAVRLAVHFDTVFVPEYARTYTGVFGVRVDATDLERIAQGQAASVAAAKPQASRILVEDTDTVLTAVWSDMLLGSRTPGLGTVAEPADLYLLCDIDLPWEDDGTRYFADIADRRRFMDACRAELERRGLRYVVIHGMGEAREQAAIDAIRTAFPGLD
ncbi:AAA family ATPase [Asticcacaulis solisilvae]|uniref:AAA family ATPase n=1 Tax=Asticcacaulis solisilvae TaxID=1217274 RepID=UPI003FD7DA89